jgi:hypothetical protein
MIFSSGRLGKKYRVLSGGTQGRNIVFYTLLVPSKDDTQITWMTRGHISWNISALTLQNSRVSIVSHLAVSTCQYPKYLDPGQGGSDTNLDVTLVPLNLSCRPSDALDALKYPSRFDAKTCKLPSP